MRAFALACLLAYRDWKHDGLLSLCAILSLVSIMLPLLILLGIRNGLITTMHDRLMDNPALLTVMPTGSGSGYTKAWLDQLAARPDVTFALLKTRDISTTLQLRSMVAGLNRFTPLDVEPTAVGDPLLSRYGAVPAQEDMITLSSLAAQRLGVKPGDQITAQLGRTTGTGRMESLAVTFTVASVLPPEAVGLSSAAVGFVLFPRVVDIEDYKDGYAVPALKVLGDPRPETERRFARFRLYARSMDDVAVIKKALEDQGIEVQTSALEIRSFQEISQALTIVFLLISLTVAVGFAASTASNVMASVRRKDRQLGMLRLLGFTGKAIMVFPLCQVLLTALCGCLLALGLYTAAGYGLDALFSAKFYGAEVALLPYTHFLIISAGVCLASILAALPACCRAAKVEPSDVLRQL